MAAPPFDPLHFFDAYPRFVDTSETGPWLDRLNARYAALVHANRHLIDGARVLDLASHDGRFSFAALQNGAERVVGIEHDADLVAAAEENMRHYRVDRERYEFVVGDMFEEIARSGVHDVVFCFGILYHITDHMRLLSEIARVEPRYLLLDTHTSQLDGAVIELRNAFGASPPPPGSYLEGFPTKAALESMVSYFGWTHEYFDWAGSGLTTSQHMGDYRVGKRVSVVVTCTPERHPPELRERAVRAVRDRQRDLSSQWLTITEVASELGLVPQVLRVWVKQDAHAPGADQPR
jgi:SAM-dependent methyltransferase